MKSSKLQKSKIWRSSAHTVSKINKAGSHIRKTYYYLKRFRGGMSKSISAINKGSKGQNSAKIWKDPKISKIILESYSNLNKNRLRSDYSNIILEYYSNIITIELISKYLEIILPSYSIPIKSRLWLKLTNNYIKILFKWHSESVVIRLINLGDILTRGPELAASIDESV